MKVKIASDLLYAMSNYKIFAKPLGNSSRVRYKTVVPVYCAGLVKRAFENAKGGDGGLMPEITRLHCEAEQGAVGM